MTYANGEKFIGGWEKDQRFGIGRLNAERESKWAMDIKITKGTYQYSNGDKYFGEHANGYKQGYGILKYANGDKFKGKFGYDQLQNGEMIKANGEC